MNVSTEKQDAAKQRKPGKSIWPKIPAPFVRAVLAGHSALGLAFAALIFLVCFSGTVVVLLEEVDRWETPRQPIIESVTPQTLETIRTEALAKYPGSHHIYGTLPTEDNPRINVYIDAVEGEPVKEMWADGNGHLMGERDAPWTSFIQRLHIYLHLPSTWGLFVVGLTGVALLSSLISGILAHPRVFRDAFHLRWGGSKRLQEADMHNRIGVWGLPFHIIVSLTGALLGLSTLLIGILGYVAFNGDINKVYSYFLPPVAVDDPRPAPLPPMEPMFAHIRQDAPEAKPSYFLFEHPGETGQTVSLTAISPNQLSRGDSWVFDGSGKLMEGGYSSTGTTGNFILQALYLLHFGWFGGWIVKIAYILLGAGLTAVTASGVAIWLARRRDKGRPAPRWERVWVAFCWSQPPAYALAAIVALVAPAAPLVPLWLVASLLAMGTAALWTPERISWRLRLIGAVLIAAIPVVHIATHGNAIADPMAWVVNVIMAGCAVLMGVSLLNPAKKKAPAPAPQAAE